jgi:beta-lactam-binding protein with PASTA domain
LPIYSLFQSDRKNEDKDEEIQNPMKTAIKQILQDGAISATLETIELEVEKASKKIADLTISKLKEMNEEVRK